jgi:hypothetical protein
MALPRSADDALFAGAAGVAAGFAGCAGAAFAKVGTDAAVAAAKINLNLPASWGCRMVGLLVRTRLLQSLTEGG